MNGHATNRFLVFRERVRSTRANFPCKEIHPSKVPFNTTVIRNIVDIIQENSNTTRHTLYFDNFFNNYEPLVKSSGLKMRAIGTIRPYHSNGADAVMLPDKQPMKQKRGAYDF
ncbi:Protein translocase subunit SecA [Trichinella spiralis]|uniref:Protein translocase subunit SecA n=1 Tax=Trichinella spiralis TaxID=6334 RepID=A0ABR3KGY7_TRISP